MVLYGEETKGCNLFDTSNGKNFVERSVKLKEEPILDFELASGDCSSPRPFEDVSNDKCSIFSDNSEMNVAEDDIYLYDSPYRPKWAETIVQAARELAGNPQEPRKTRSQTSKASFASDSALAEHCYMLISSEPQTYQQYCTDLRWKSAMEDELQSLQENNTWELVPLPPKRKLVQCKWVFWT